ncbi:MAG: hypothetical protein PHV17_06155 [Candidatus Omnitrophica bacterium]|nr:hypothetical protein [Candidatus Omnitrophota bacterium]
MSKKTFLEFAAIPLFLSSLTFLFSTPALAQSKKDLISSFLDSYEKKSGLNAISAASDLRSDQPANVSPAPKKIILLAKAEETGDRQLNPTTEYFDRESEDIKETFFSDADIGGHYQLRYYADRKKDASTEHTQEIRQDLRLELKKDISNRYKVLFSIDGQYDLVHSSRDGYDSEEKTFRVWESYVSYLYENFNLTLGRQVIRWGKGDEINPTDNFTPENFKEYLNLDRADRKMPVLMARLNYSFAPYQIETVWLPFPEPNVLPESDSDYEPYLIRQYRDSALGFDVKRPQRPARSLKNQVVAVKFKRNTLSYDTSLSYAYHWAQMPALYRNLNNLTLETLYARQHTFGGDFETVAGNFGVRGEWAYTLGDIFVTESPDCPDTTIEKDSLTAIFGFDYTSQKNFYSNLQYMFKYVPDHSSGMASGVYEDSVLGKVSKKFRNDTLLFEVAARLYLFNLDRYYRLKCQYEIKDDLTVSVGYDNFFGPTTATFGQYNQNDQYFATVKYSF